MIRPMAHSDSTMVLEIYDYGLSTRNATFETRLPSWEEWDRNHHRHSRFVYVDQGKILGWAALSPTSKRKVYEGVAEVSVYIAKGASGKGIGTLLLNELIDSSEKNGIWTLHSSLFPENKASVRLHEKCGFRQVGLRKKIAKLDDEWRDTLIMERRSHKF